MSVRIAYRKANSATHAHDPISQSRAPNLSARRNTTQARAEARDENETARVVMHRPVATLRTNAHNARTHDEKQISQIAASIEKFGFTNPILIDEKGAL